MRPFWRIIKELERRWLNISYKKWIRKFSKNREHPKKKWFFTGKRQHDSNTSSWVWFLTKVFINYWYPLYSESSWLHSCACFQSSSWSSLSSNPTECPLYCFFGGCPNSLIQRIFCSRKNLLTLQSKNYNFYSSLESLNWLKRWSVWGRNWYIRNQNERVDVSPPIEKVKGQFSRDCKPGHKNVSKC